MKKIPLLLVFLAIISCVHREKAVYSTGESDVTDSLSEISQMITAIPLETNLHCRLSDLKQVIQASSYIFIRSGNDIYRFNRSGAFINRVTRDNYNMIRRFAVDPDRQQVVVLDSLNLVHYYSFDGNMLLTEDAELCLPGQIIFDIAYHDNFLWAVTENISVANYIEKWLYKLDLSFRPLEGTRLATVDLGRFYLDAGFTSELSVAERMVYVYSPFSFKETLLRDTLYLISNGWHNQEKPSSQPTTGSALPAYTIPFRWGKRYILASYRTHESENANYLYCFDRKTNKGYNLYGFKDDFFHTGIVKDLQPLDPYNQEYYFYKSGKDVSASFPDREENANPVLFFVKLNV